MVDVIIALVLLQYLLFGALVSKARGKYGVKAPATTGHDVFERYYRVQMNTLEQLILLLPLMLLARSYVAEYWVALAGVLYLIGRFLYFRAYVADPRSRSLGFTLGLIPVLLLLLVVLVGGLWQLLS
ncbi:MAPEG family protein [Permianibacter fluminis]|uniref:MAPEG family protein n=1 Tax=Permianibacter fluminis TaxID=2738515 RepID=UPI001B7D8512|nr:MAPEG family protein [Permianibacter fluminis]